MRKSGFIKQPGIMYIPVAFFSVILLTFTSCREPDYRDDYTGSFIFTVDGFKFISGVPMDKQIEHFPTRTYHGTIRTYSKGDYTRDLNQISSNEYEDTDQRLTIDFLYDNMLYRITPGISENGELVEEYGNHYHVKGQFNNIDEIEFIINNLGTAGYSLTYNVKGVRE